MGRGEPATADDFSRAISRYVRTLVQDAGGDSSGRWLANRLSRGTTYYRDRLVGTKTFDTNDLSDLAQLFRLDPAELIDQALLAMNESSAE